MCTVPICGRAVYRETVGRAIGVSLIASDTVVAASGVMQYFHGDAVQQQRLLLDSAIAADVAWHAAEVTVPTAATGPVAGSNHHSGCSGPDRFDRSWFEGSRCPAQTGNSNTHLTLPHKFCATVAAAVDAGSGYKYCSWKYVICDTTGRVVEGINMTTDTYEVVFSGQLPPASVLKGLPGLREIDIRLHMLKGELPSK